jgi:uncharacterized protein
MKTLASVLLIPGLYNSGPEHWQSIWGVKHPEYHRVQQDDWETPRCSNWMQTLICLHMQYWDGPGCAGRP